MYNLNTYAIIIPWQSVPLPKYPSGQVQLYEPRVLLQLAFSSHLLSSGLLHSSTSVRGRRLKMCQHFMYPAGKHFLSLKPEPKERTHRPPLIQLLSTLWWFQSHFALQTVQVLIGLLWSFTFILIGLLCYLVRLFWLVYCVTWYVYSDWS